MNKRSVLTSVAVLAAVVSLSVASPAEAGKGMKANKKNSKQASNDFSLSTAYTGYLSEVLTINNAAYTVSPNACVYVLGEGPVPAGMMVYNRSIFVSGERVNGQSVVQSIIVLPMVADSGTTPTAGEVPPNTPR